MTRRKAAKLSTIAMVLFLAYLAIPTFFFGTKWLGIALILLGIPLALFILWGAIYTILVDLF